MNPSPHARSRSRLNGALVTLAAALTLSTLGACSEALPLKGVAPAAWDLGVADQGADMGADAGAPVEAAPTVRITSPADGARLDEATTRIRIEGVAADDQGVASVWVRVGPNVALPARSEDGFRTWWIEADAPAGTSRIEAAARDVSGLPTDAPDSVLVTRDTSMSDAQPPTVRIDAPGDGDTPLFTTVLLEGAASDDRGVVRMEVYRDGALLAEREVRTQDGFRAWTRLLPLVPGQTSEVEVVAYDAAGQRGSATIRLTGRAQVDEAPPTLAITSPADGASIDADTLVVQGRAEDLAGVREVKVRWAPLDAAGQPTRWSEDVLAETFDGFFTWRAALPVTAGPLTVEARAIDVNGLVTRQVVDLQNDFVAAWSEERVVFLRVRDGEPRPVVKLELDRDAIDALISPEIQQGILLLELDPTPLLTATLGAIKTACGTAWRQDNPNPQHDCDLSALGRSFTQPWRQSPEYALVRILTMTPANVKVEGTSIEGLQELADGGFFGITIGGGFNQILADALGVPRTQEIVPTAGVVEALKVGLLAPHPNTLADGRIPVTMFDAMNDMAPLGARLGPSGEHPGIMAPGFVPQGAVFTPDFVMALTAESNLRWLDGVDLSRLGKDYMATIDDARGPTFDDVLEFDFTDPARFDVRGLVAAPTVDLRFALNEADRFIGSCTNADACKGNLPGSPHTASFVWSLKGWLLERIVAAAARTTYAARTFSKCYINFFGCHASVNIGQGGDPAAWTRFDIILGLGSPPEDQYLWDLINEVAQVALHRLPDGTTFAEGDADVAFTVRDVPVGVTADEIRDGVRPHLQAQASQISAQLLGDWSRHNGPIDLFYQRGADGVAYLKFVAPSDPRPGGYAYTQPGLYASPDLTPASKRSDTSPPASGDTIHEQLPITPGLSETLYARDDLGGVYRLRVRAPADDDREITIRVARRMR